MNLPPLRTRDIGDPVMLRQSFIEKRIIRIHDLRNAPVGLEQVLEEEHRLLVDRSAKAGVEGRKQLLVLLVQLVKAPHVKPLRAELYSQRTNALVPEHPRGLLRKPLRIVKQAGCGKPPQLGIRG